MAYDVYAAHPEAPVAPTIQDLMYRAFAAQAPTLVLLDGTLTATTVAAPLGTVSTPCRNVIIQADPDNAVAIFVGNATSQSVQIAPGGSETFEVNNVATIYVKAASGTAVVNWHARG